MHQVNRVLVAVDFSAQSRAALNYATFVAKNFHASLEVLHVWQAPHFGGLDFMLQLPNLDVAPLDTFVKERAQQELAEFIAAGEVDDKVAVTCRLEAGDAESVIVDVAAKEGCDLIVMGTHGRSGVAHLLMGSVAEKVLRHAPCPVVTICGKDAGAAVS